MKPSPPGVSTNEVPEAQQYSKRSAHVTSDDRFRGWLLKGTMNT